MTRYFFCDYETFRIAPGLQAPPPACLAYAWDDDDVDILHANFDYERAQRTLWEALHCRRTHVVAHRLAFEWVVTAAWRPDWMKLLLRERREGRLHCTLGRDKLIRISRGDNTEGFDLGSACRYYGVDVDIDKSFWGRTEYGSLWDTPVSDWSEEFVRYSAQDVVGARSLFWAQNKQDSRGALNGETERMTVSASISLALTSCWGLETDDDLARALIANTEERLAAGKEELLKAGLIRWKRDKGVVKLARSKKAAEAVITKAYADLGRAPPRTKATKSAILKAYEAAGLEPPDIEKPTDADIEEARERCGDAHLDGNISLNKEACENSGSALMQAYADFGQATGLLARLSILTKPLIQPGYNEVVNTGRTSSRQGDRPPPMKPWTVCGTQIQNLHRYGTKFTDAMGVERDWGVREVFTAHGYRAWLQRGRGLTPAERMLRGDMPPQCLITCDYSQQEARTWAWRCMMEFGFSKMADILNDPGRCCHVEFGAEIEQISVAEAYAMKKVDPKRYKKMRDRAKGPIYGLPGGMGPERLQDYVRQYGWEIDLALATYLAKELWPSFFPEGTLWRRYWGEVCRKGRAKTVVQPEACGGMVRGNVTYCAAANGGFQGPAAYISKLAGERATDEAYGDPSSPLWGARPVLFVHDEWGFVADTERAPAAAWRLAAIMRQAGEDVCQGMTFPVEPAISFRYGKAFGDTKLDPQGNLVPYELAEAHNFWKEVA